MQTQALASRIVFDGTRASGVHYQCAGTTTLAQAAREVIVCAGAINSPLLLQASGIGPAPLLQSLGVAVVRHSPAVGQHLQDHLCVDHLYRSRVPTLNDQLRPWHGKVRAALHYLFTRGGPLALSVNQGGGFVRSRPELARPNLQLYFSPLSYTRSPPGKRPLMSPDPFPGFLLSAQPCRPSSRGHVQLRAADPLAAPLIVPNSLATAHDVDELVEGSMFLRRLCRLICNKVRNHGLVMLFHDVSYSHIKVLEFNEMGIIRFPGCNDLTLQKDIRNDLAGLPAHILGLDMIGYIVHRYIAAEFMFMP